MHVGRDYDPIIRINSQSGKGGIAYILEQYYGLILPKPIQQAFSKVVTKVSDSGTRELRPDEIHHLFQESYVDLVEPIKLKSYREEMIDDQTVKMSVSLYDNKKEIVLDGIGNGPLDAFCKALQNHIGSRVEIISYNEHALERGSTSKAITYVQVQNGDNNIYIGAGISSNVSKSSLRAVISAVNQMNSVTNR
jgi:2-isopropylmalate synthase